VFRDEILESLGAARCVLIYFVQMRADGMEKVDEVDKEG